MKSYHELFFLILAFFSEFAGTLSGVSSSSLFVPVAVFFESVQLTLVLTACLHVIGNTTRTFMYWKHIDWKLTLQFGIPSIIMTGLGAQISGYLPKNLFSIILGFFLISISVVFWMMKDSTLNASRSVSYFGGGLSGFLTGAVGSGGAIRSLALSAFNLTPLTFTATSTLIDFGGDLLRLQIYLQKGYLDKAHYFYVPLLMIVAFLANWLAKKWLQRINQQVFRRIVLAFVFGAGMISISTGLISLFRS
ncbi:sulfite exporter TauE/SafE family protein [Pseudobdellovibrio sp. HCB154]|uniref:sulfite exporter TauE/SafE family protein n=1 Tax=Pseudobdellovibrio sp. HCB154 TaxID=3386277 RepID=UPI003917401D